MLENAHREWLNQFVLIYRKGSYTVTQDVFDLMKFRGLLFDRWTIGSDGSAKYIGGELDLLLTGIHSSAPIIRPKPPGGSHLPRRQAAVPP